jgi:hypothetical protein
MNKYLVLITVLLTAGCTHTSKIQNKSVTPNPTSEKFNKNSKHLPTKDYSDRQLESFLDSIGHLPTQPLADRAAFAVDSVFKSPKQMDTMISAGDFETLKQGARKGMMKVDIARRIFKNFNISYDCNVKSVMLTYKKGLIPVVYTAFSKEHNGFDEFALCIGDPAHCDKTELYFFKRNRIIALHDGYDRFAAEMKYYKDADGKMVVYYGKNFDEGTGVWWDNLFFYKYDGDRLIPILNELNDANLLQSTPWGGDRSYWFKTFIIKTSPLTIKMVYYQQFLDDRDSVKFINDSTLVRYKWDDRSKTLRGQYDLSKISKAQILSYYLFGQDKLFINTHYVLLKHLLANPLHRKSELMYLNAVKSEISSRVR